MRAGLTSSASLHTLADGRHGIGRAVRYLAAPGHLSRTRIDHAGNVGDLSTNASKDQSGPVAR